MTVVAMEHVLKETVATPTDLLKALSVKHEYYHSADHTDTYNGISAFLESWKTYDIDLNRVIRWDVREVKKEFICAEEMEPEELAYYGPWDSTYAELHFVAPRKGHTYTVRIINLKAGDTPRLYTFLKQHWEHTQQLWDPLPRLEYVEPVTPRSRFLEQVQAVGSRFRLPVAPGGNYVGDDIVRRVNGTIEGILQVIDTGYLMFEKPKSEDQPLDINLNIAGELANIFSEINN